MEYPGDATLDPKVRQRVLTAFSEAVRLYREGHNEESRTILRSINDVDPRFSPAQRLEQAIAAGAPVDLRQLIGDVTAHASADIEGLLVKARQALTEHDFAGAATLAQAVLRELPGHAEARQITVEAQARSRAAGDVEAHLSRARQALDAGLAEEARGFLRLAQNAQHDHPDIAVLERRLQLAAKPLDVQPEPEFEFEVFEPTSPTEGLAAAPPPAPPAGASEPAAPEPGEPRPVGASKTPGPVAAAPAAAAVPPALPPAPAPPASAPASTPVAAPAAPASPAAPRPTAVPAAPPAQVQTPPPPAPEAKFGPASAFTFDAAEPSAAPDFQSVGEPPAGTQPAAASAEDQEARVQSLLDQGQQEFDRGDFQAAIDSWSRIYLIDAHQPEAERRIEQARGRKEEAERLAEHRFYEAREAFEQGRWDDARGFCQEVLKLQPQHLEAHDLLLRLDTPAAPPPPPAPSLAEEDDLFRDDFVPARISSSGAVPAEPSAAAAKPARSRTAAVGKPRLAAGFPVTWLAIGAAVVVVLVAGVLLLRGKVFSGGAAAVTEAMTEADKLASSGRFQEAVQLLQSLQDQAEGEQANRVNQRLLDYRRKLRAKPSAPKGADLKPVQAALAAGNHVKALQLVREQLARVANDPELNRLQDEIVGYSSSIPALLDALDKRNWESARQLTSDLLRRHPEDVEAHRIWAASSYNFAVELLRKYQVAQAHDVLNELAKTEPDPQVVRLRDFAQSYLSRPADPRYKFFVDDLELRTPA
jgi:tetratricopeptide (TPR) repeat protein